ncbi:hypothetical protein [Flavobacterium daejeonense]|uniref:hypothetical protein n=1 Tax=Flavobacterium daejeonense TaxID=350893 RepID=UPI00047BCE0A|nr:hypothetical protein [Flavobacterium daejeonense]
MNKIFLILSILGMSGISCTTKIKKPNMEVKINIIGKLNSNEFKGKNGTFYSINIDLINNTDATTRFWVLSCSWQDNWIFNGDAIDFYSQGCDKNYPTIIEIKPRQKLTYNGIIHIKSNKEVGIKLGFVLIKEHDIVKMSDFRSVLINKIKNQKDIIWGNLNNHSEIH